METELTDLRDREQNAVQRCASIPADEEYPDQVRAECAKLKAELADAIARHQQDLRWLREECGRFKEHLAKARTELAGATENLEKAERALAWFVENPGAPTHIVESWEDHKKAALRNQEIAACGADRIEGLIRECAAGRTTEFVTLRNAVLEESKADMKFRGLLQKMMLMFNVRLTKPTAPGYYYPIMERVSDVARKLDARLENLGRFDKHLIKDKDAIKERSAKYETARSASADGASLRQAAISGGVYVGVPPQANAQIENDCAVWAISHATGVKYDEVRGFAQEAMRYAKGDPIGPDTQTYCTMHRPELILKHNGMNLEQIAATAAYFGAVQTVVLSDFAKALSQTGRPILVALDVGGGHSVIVNGVFEHDKNIYIATVDSQLASTGGSNVVYWEAGEFAKVLLGEGSIVYPAGYRQRR